MQIIGLAAMSLDGFITRGNEPGTAFTSPEDKAWFREVTKDFSVKIMGRRTFEVSREYILQQIEHGDRSSRFVLTSNPSAHKAFQKPGSLEFTNRNPEQIVNQLSETHADAKIAVLGGGAVYSAFLNANLLDEFWITLEPKIFGTGTPIVTEPSMNKLTLIETHNLGPSTLLLKYRCKS